MTLGPESEILIRRSEVGHGELHLFVYFKFSRIFGCSARFETPSSLASGRAVRTLRMGVVSPGDSFAFVYLSSFYQSLTLDQILLFVLRIKL